MNQRHNYDHDDHTSVAGFKIAFIAFLVLLVIALGIKAASAQTIYLPSISQRCGNPCAHSVPMPTTTSTPDIGEPPMSTMPTAEAQP